MRKLILSTGLLMTALTALVFVVYQVAAEPDAQGGAATGESSPIAERRDNVTADRKARQLLERIAEDEPTHSADDVIGRAKVAAGPNANAVLSLDLDIDASDPKRDDGNKSGTVAGAGTDVVVEVFITGLAGPILGGEFSIDTNRLTVKSAAATPGLSVLGTTARTVSFGGFPPGVALPNGYLGTVTLTTVSDVTGTEFTVSASINVADGTNIGETDMLTAATPLTFNAMGPTPDFDSDGTVGFSDFLAFAGRYGAQRGDSRYQAKYDLNSDGAIDFRDFLSFAGSYGSPVPPPPPPGGGSSGPDLIVESPSVSDNTLTPGQTFTLQATVRNRGTARSASTTLTYYRSSNATISTSDTEVGTDSVSGLSASRTSAESISLTAPSSTGTYYYGACVASVSGESNTNNNCSDAVRVTVSGGGGGGGGSSSPDLIVESPSVSDSTLTPGQSFTLQATVRNRGTGQSAETTLRYYRSSDATIATSDTEVGTDSVSGLSASGTSAESISLTAPSSAGTYYYGACVASVSGESNTDNNCSDGVRVAVVELKPDLIVESPSVSDSTLTPGQSFTLRATVRNRGTGQSASTTLRYYRSSDATIATSDTEVGTDSISGLSASGTGSESISLTAPSGSGTYYYGACVASVSGESNTDNNCSDGVRVTVSSGGGGGVGTPKMYWRDTGTEKIQRANLDGSQVEDLITTGLRTPLGIALDVGRGKMYWTDYGTEKIQRANLDGSQVEDLITTGLTTPVGIALDVGRGKMYWTDTGTDKIQRANLDGSNVEDLITTGLRTPEGIALDVGREKMYWTDWGTDKIQRANLDGSNVEDLITTGLTTPLGIALDVGRGKMYWTDNGTDKIQRANLDGSNVEDLITTGLTTPLGIALDVGRGKMYWTDNGTDKIQRANLDGSNVEDLITTGLTTPGGIALDTSGAGSISRPDLIVESPSVSDSTLTPGQSFTLRATVRNRGTARSAATTLRYYRSSNATIATSDTEVGTASVSGLSASGMGSESISLTAPSGSGTYYYGACVASVSGESKTNNNCSTGVRVTVSDDHSNTRSGATSLSLGGSRSGRIETAGDVDYFRVQVSSSGTLTVYTTGNTDTYGTLQSSSGSTLEIDGDGGSGTNFSIARSVSAGTYYIAVRGYGSSETGSYTVHASFQSGGGSDDHSNTRSGATSLSLGGSRSGRIETGGDVDYFRVQVSIFSSSGTLTVYTTGNTDTYGTLQSSSGSTLETDDDDGSGTNFSIARSVSAGTYYIAVRGYSSSETGSYTVHASFQSGGGGGGGGGSGGGGSSSPDLIVESPSVSDNTPTPGQSLTLRATVLNRGTVTASPTTLRYYLSADATITTGDLEVGTADAISALAASATSVQSSSVPVSAIPGTYYYGACVASVSGESNTNNNCSEGVRVTVSSGGGGGSSSPDLIVESPSVSDNTLTPGQSFTLRATVRNRGTARSAATTLRYYRSSNSTISTSDTEVGTDSVSGLSASGTGSESIRLTAPSSTGTYYYGACVASVSGESNTDNNCSEGVRVTVSSGSGGGGGGSDDHSNTRSGATSLSLGGSRSGRIETGGDVDYFRVQVSSSGTLTVYTTGSTDTYGTLQNSSGTTLATNDDGGSGTNFSIARSVSAGTYYIAVRGYSSSETGSYTVHASFQSGGSSSPDLIVESPSVSDNTLTPGQSFTLRATVRNRGTARSAATTLRYYRSSNSTISTSDTEVGTDSVSGLSASGTGSESISLRAPSRAGTYYYGACVASVSGESNTNNNCSTGVRVTVSSGGGGGGGGSGSLGACRVGLVVRPNQSCQISGGEFRNVGGGCFVYTPFGSGRFCLGRSFNLNGFRGTRVGNDYRIDGLP